MRIAEVSKQFGISADTLRYYERIGLLSHVHRNESGIRDYGEQDLARIRFVKCMRGDNVSIEALIEYMELFEGGDATRRAFYLQFFSACTNLSRPDTPSRKRGRICAAWAPPAGANGAVCRFPRRLCPLRAAV